MRSTTKTTASLRKPWFETGLELARVDAKGEWRDSAATFSDWVNAEAEKFGLSRSNLWRYLAAVRYYEVLRERLSAAKITSPRVEHLPATVGPESLELLGKLERAMPGNSFYLLAGEVIAGKVRRAKLREMWLAFRPALGGRTARGRDTPTPIIDLRDPEQRVSVLEAMVFTALTNYGPSWTGVTDPILYKLVPNVVPEVASDARSHTGPGRVTTLDLVAIVQKAPNSATEYHGIEIRGVLLPEGVGRLLLAQSLYVHSMWLALPEMPSPASLDGIPNKIGLLVATKNKLEVVRVAEPRPNDGLTGQLAKGLVARLLRR